MIFIYSRIISEHKRICREIDSITRQLSKYPKGKLICCHDKNKCKWYVTDISGSRKYLSKKERPLAEKLAAKKYLSAHLDDLIHKEKALAFYLNHHRESSSKAHRLLTELPGYKELLSPYFQPLSQELVTWMNAPYEKNPFGLEHLIHPTTAGQMVRSKSEAMISHFLTVNRIPFRYECALQLDSRTIYPDFMIRHPRTGELYYWEHFGMMDDPVYAQKAASKIQQYISKGIIPSIHLITTYETLGHPLSTETIQKIIEHYFL